jgi:hypothetical protein
MAIMPGVISRPLGVQTQSRMVAHDIVCLHTMAGFLSSTDGYFRTGNGAGYAGTESHYGVGGAWGPDAERGLDGAVWQWQDRAFQADANLQGSHRIISVETADNAKRPIEPWTAKQCEAIARILAFESQAENHADCPSSWACHQVGIPLVLVPDSKPSRRGVAYHRQGCAPYTAAGGERWSKSYGKDCPTQARINQIPGILARARELASGAVPVVEDDMFESKDREKLDKTFYAVNEIILPALGKVAARVAGLASTPPVESVGADEVAAKVLAGLPDSPTAGDVAREILSQLGISR